MSRSYKCYKCKKIFPAKNFNVDRSRTAKIQYLCKQCKSDYDKGRYPARRQKNILKDLEKFKTRASSRYIFSDRDFRCSVIGCNKKAELHHIDYRDPEAVLPICKIHHAAIHSLKFLEKIVNKARAETGV